MSKSSWIVLAAFGVIAVLGAGYFLAVRTLSTSTMPEATGQQASEFEQPGEAVNFADPKPYEKKSQPAAVGAQANSRKTPSAEQSEDRTEDNRAANENKAWQDSLTQQGSPRSASAQKTAKAQLTQQEDTSKPKTTAPKIERETVRYAMRSLKPELKQCADEVRKEFPELGGKITLNFALVSSGGIGTVKYVGVNEATTLDDSKLQKCLMERVKTLKFDVGDVEDGSSVRVTYPFTF